MDDSTDEHDEVSLSGCRVLRSMLATPVKGIGRPEAKAGLSAAGGWGPAEAAIAL